MPICRVQDTWLYFAHVPKCAGTAIEHYLRARFGPLGLHDGGYAIRTPQEAWSTTPPQHMPEAVRREILPDALFDGIFASIRHPVTRLRSVFLFQRDVERALPARVSFRHWINTLPRSLALDPYTLHGHLRPMVEFVPKTADVFRIEDGLDAVIDWIDARTGSTDGPRTIAPANTLAERIETQPSSVQMTPEILDIIATLYAADFDRFGYPLDPNDMEGTA